MHEEAQEPESDRMEQIKLNIDQRSPSPPPQPRSYPTVLNQIPEENISMVKSTTQRQPEESHMDKTALSCLISPTMGASAASDAKTAKMDDDGQVQRPSEEEEDSEVYIRSLPKARSIQEILKDHNKSKQ